LINLCQNIAGPVFETQTSTVSSRYCCYGNRAAGSKSV